MENELKHLAVILDGNRRCAEKQGLDIVEGHRRGAERVLELVENLEPTGIEYLTLYAFSTENWKRPENEVNALMGLLCDFLDQYTDRLVKKQIRLRFAGRRERIPEACLKRMDLAVEATRNGKRTVIVALNYGGRAELADAAKKIAAKIRLGGLDEDHISEETVAENLYLPDVPDVDLLIRPGGEQRISNFLLWQISYAELYFTNTLWPDFDRSALDSAIHEFQHRKRRFGGK